jgi:TldD protein
MSEISLIEQPSRRRVYSVSGSRDALASAAGAAAWSGKFRAVPEDKTAILAPGRFKNKSSVSVTSDGLQDVREVIFDLTLWKAKKLGKLIRGETGTGQQADDPLARCLRRGQHSGHATGSAREFQVEWLPGLWQDEATMPFLLADEMADLALKRVAASGAEYGDIRFLKSTAQTIAGEDGRISSIRDADDSGFGIRVLYHGGWGFAASSIVSLEEVPRIADLAVDIARGSASLASEKTRLVDEPVHRDRVVTHSRIDPFTVSLAKKTTLLREIMDCVQSRPDVVRSSASLWARRDQKLFVSTEGTRLEFDLLAVQGEFTATALYDGRFASRSFSTPHLRTGYELIEGADFMTHAPRIASEAVEKVKAPAVRPGLYDLVLDPEHLSLTMHESCGHPSELDRALGYEANYAGTSFLTPEKRGTFRYGSRHVNLVADNTEPETLAATGYDDDGVACQRWDIVREGLFVGYCTNREVAGKIGDTRSSGSNRADSWGSVPIVRIANIGLEPGSSSVDELLGDVKRGIYIEGHGSYSIDQRRYNFQFGGDAF